MAPMPVASSGPVVNDPNSGLQAPPPSPYSTIGGVASDNLFNPANANNFYDNFNNFAVNYSADTTQDQQRYNDLVAAYKYASDPNNQAALDQEGGQGYSQFLLQELQADLGEQQNLITQGTAQQKSTADAGNLNYINGIWSNVTGGGQGSAGDWGALAQILKQNGNPMASKETTQAALGYANTTPMSYSDIIAAALNGNRPDMLYKLSQVGDFKSLNLPGIVQGTMGADQTALSTAQNAAVQGFTLNNPYYKGAEQKVNDYYYGTGQNDPNSQIYQATQAADQNIYDQVYNIKNEINSQAAMTGVSNSGERQKALSDVQGQGTAAAVKLRQDAENQAQQAIQSQQKADQQAQNTQQGITNQVKGSDLQNLFSTATGNEIGSYNSQTGANNQQNTLNAEQKIAQQQANDNMFNNIFGDIGQGVGKLGGLAVTGALI